MANIKISDLTAASAAADANEYEINEAGTSKKVTGSQIKAFVNAGDGALASKNTVATADIDNLAVTTAKLAADAVDGTKIADDAIDSEHYAAGSIDAEHIATSAVTAPKVAGADGSSGQVLQSDGDGTMSWLTLAAGGGFSNMEVYTSPGTWTNPGNVEKVKVTVVGGGGSTNTINTAFASQGASVCGGGGGGGTAIEIIPFPSATNVPVTVGGAAGTSSFGAYCSATGGSTANTVTNSYYSIANGANGGSGSGGTLNISGSNGGFIRGGNQGFDGGSGGGSALGQGAHIQTYSEADGVKGTPVAGSGYGAGASGGYVSSGAPAVPGKSGAPGVVIVEY